MQMITYFLLSFESGNGVGGVPPLTCSLASQQAEAGSNY